jgi:hypothetical protein
VKVLAVEFDAELVCALSLPIVVNVNEFVAFVSKNVADARSGPWIHTDGLWVGAKASCE